MAERLNLFPANCSSTTLVTDIEAQGCSKSLSLFPTGLSSATLFADLEVQNGSPLVKGHSEKSLFVTLASIINDQDSYISDKPLPSLPSQIDRGKAAWTFMAAAMIIDAVIWGFPLNFGVFQNYYATHEPFMGNYYISMIGTFATGIAYLGGPLMAPITIKLCRYRQHMVLFGTVLCITANIGASFCTDILVLVLCQGVLYGIGFLIISYCTFSMLNEWLVERRGLAYGILLSAAGLSGLGLPFLFEMLLGRYGYANTLRIYALATAIIVFPTIFLLRSYPSEADPSASKATIDYSVMKKPIFTILSFCNFLQGLVFYLPAIFLPSYATAASLSPTQSSILLATLNLSTVLGTLLFGYLSDIIDIHILLSISCFGSSLSVFLLWGLPPSILSSTSTTSTTAAFLLLILFATTYGFLAGSFESLFPRFATAMTEDPDAEITFYGFFEFERGLGMVLAGPFASVLLGETVEVGVYGLGMYMGIVMFVGSVLFVSSLAGVGWFFRNRRRYK